MIARISLCLLILALFTANLTSPSLPACAPAPPLRPGDRIGVLPVVNADQSVIILWDAASKTQHFIRKASFKSEADDFGFLVPSPTQPELEESGNDAFPYLYNLTKPEIVKKEAPQGGGCGCIIGCGKKEAAKGPPPVTVIEEKLVAGFHASVLKAKSPEALAGWLKDNGYAFSSEVQIWAKPYVDDGWVITALKVAKDTEDKTKTDVAASALRMTFKTDRPLFPYREPDSTAHAAALRTTRRLLRIYFLAEARYRGELTEEVPWTGKPVWAGKVGATDRARLLELLKLPETAGPSDWWLTEFEDDWPYRIAPADVCFSRATDQSAVKRPAIIEFTAATFPMDLSVYAIAALFLFPPLFRFCRRRCKVGRAPLATRLLES